MNAALQIAIAKSRLALLKVYDEAQHPRDEDGKWTDSGGRESLSQVALKADVSSGPVKIDSVGPVIVYRAGSLTEKEIYFADSVEAANEYAVLHPGSKSETYSVTASNVLAAKGHSQLYASLYPGKTLNDAIWSEDKKSGFKSSLLAMRNVQSRMMAKVRAQGYNAVLFTAPLLPAKHELIVLNYKRVKIERS